MNDAHKPFYAILAAICYLTTLAAILSALGKLTEAVGVAGAVTGLLALARLPGAVQPTATTTTGDINVKEPTT
jgi:hypothetical protein